MKGLFKKIADYLSLIKFSHTVFAMPFALLGFFTAVSSDRYEFSGRLLFLVILCMVFARNAAMGFNRFTDKHIDARNPRTAGREIPSGKISPGAVLVFVVVNSILFIVSAGFINRLTLVLSPVALLVILGYSLTKRFTSLSHFFLGLSLSLSPVGAYIAVTGHFDIIPVLYGIIVLTWVGGFDIIYSVQDEGFDKSNDLFSIPARLGSRLALTISRILHLLSAGAVIAAGFAGNKGLLYFAGSGIFMLMLVIEHFLARPGDSKRINMAFATVNSFAGLIFSSFAIADIYITF